MRLEDRVLNESGVPGDVFDDVELGEDLDRGLADVPLPGEAIAETSCLEPGGKSRVKAEGFLVAEEGGLRHVEHLGLAHSLMVTDRSDERLGPRGLFGPVPRSVSRLTASAYRKGSFRVQSDRSQAMLSASPGTRLPRVRPAAPRTPTGFERVEARDLEGPAAEQ